MLIRQQNSYAPLCKRHTGLREAQSYGPGPHIKNSPGINYAFLSVNIAINQNCLATFGESFPYRISCNMYNDLWNIQHFQFMALGKQGFFMHHYG
jgi:hypothetical protein